MPWCLPSSPFLAGAEEYYWRTAMKIPAAGCHGKTQAVVAEWMKKDGHVVDGGKGRVRRWGAPPNTTWEHCLVHSLDVATHCVGSGCCALVMFP